MGERSDADFMGRAIRVAETARFTSAPNPWVGAVVVNGAKVFEGATEPPGGPHAEIKAIEAAGDVARGAELFTTLEPCGHQGRTGPCTEAIIAAGIERVVIGVEDPDPQVKGQGIEQLRAAGIKVDVGIGSGQIKRQLEPYLHQRRTGRPFVVVKLAASLDGRTAAPDGTSKWITGEVARADVHRLRALSDAVLVGAGTIRADNPRLNVRDFVPPDGIPVAEVQPRRIVLGKVPADARVQPCTEMAGDLGELLDQLGREGVLQLLVEGGPHVAGSFHRAGLVDSYIVYLAPTLFGGDDSLGIFTGKGAPTTDDVWRGRIVETLRVGQDLRIEVRP